MSTFYIFEMKGFVLSCWLEPIKMCFQFKIYLWYEGTDTKKKKKLTARYD